MLRCCLRAHGLDPEPFDDEDEDCVWQCDFCPQTFDSFLDAYMHEVTVHHTPDRAASRIQRVWRYRRRYRSRGHGDGGHIDASHDDGDDFVIL